MALALNTLWNEGITRFLDANDRPIIYGTNDSDALSANQIDNIYDESDPIIRVGINTIEDLETYQENGVVLIGGDGNDELSGDKENDILYGGEGNEP